MKCLFYSTRIKQGLFLLLTLINYNVALAYKCDFEVDNICYEITSSSTNEVSVTCRSISSGYSSDYYSSHYKGDVVIPSSVTYNDVTYKVTGVYQNAFYECTSLTSVCLPNTIKSIGNDAFEDCRNLTSIILPKDLNSIGSGAFDGCTTLANVYIPDRVESIGSYAFSNTAWYNNQPEGMVYAGKIAYKFKGTMPENTEVTLKEGTTGIADGAFYNCSGLTSIIIPNSVYSIGSTAFSGCNGLTSVTIETDYPPTITSTTFPNYTNASLYVRQNCMESYKNADYWKDFNTISTIPICIIEYDGLYYRVDGKNGTAQLVNKEFINQTSGSYSSFNDYRGDIVIPDEIIVPRFEWLVGAEDVYTDDGEPYTYEHTFSVIILNSGESVDDGEFGEEWWRWFNHGSLRVVSIGNAFSNSYNLNSVTLPNSITEIPDEAFKNSHIASIIIPNSVTGIGSRAFRFCDLNSIAIPSSVRSIGEESFSFCHYMTSVSIPSSVISIGHDAFYGCDNLVAVTSELETPVTISENTFSNRTNATLNVPLYCKSAYERADYWKDFKEITPTNFNISFVDPEIKRLCVENWDTDNDGELSMAEAGAVTSLGEVFRTSNWEIITFDELRFFKGLTSINFSDELSGCSNLTSLTIPSNVKSLGSYHGYFTHLESIKVDAENTAYDSRKDCNAIIDTRTNTLILGCKNTIIPSDVKTIGHYAFQNCWELTSITIPYGVETIGSGAFWYTGITQVNLPNSVSYVDWWAFDGTPWEQNQPEGLIYIGKVAYKYKGTMPNNTSIAIKDGTLGIAGGAFDGIKNLTSVTIPNGVLAIGRYAFHSTGVKTIDFPESVYKMGLSVFGGDPGTPWFVSQPDGMIYLGKVAYRYKGKITEPNLIIKDGTRGIAGDAFMYQDGLISVTIPSTVEHIDERAFVDCNNLVKVMIDREKPLVIDASVFTNRKNATLYVPNGCTAAYMDAPYWNEFKVIKEMEELYPIKMNDVEALTGSQKAVTLSVKEVEEMENVLSKITAFQIEISLPDGVTVAGQKLSERADDHTLACSRLANGNWQFAGISLSSSAFSGSEGALMDIVLSIDKDMAIGTYPIEVKNIELTTTDGEAITLPDFTVTLTVSEGLTGDVNGDGRVSITDAVCVVNHVLQRPDAQFREVAADANGDGRISITDAVTIVNMVLKGDSQVKAMDPQ